MIRVKLRNMAAGEALQYLFSTWSLSKREEHIYLTTRLNRRLAVIDAPNHPELNQYAKKSFNKIYLLRTKC